MRYDYAQPKVNRERVWKDFVIGIFILLALFFLFMWMLGRRIDTRYRTTCYNCDLLADLADTQSYELDNDNARKMR